MDNRTIEQVRDNETRLIKELQQKENIIKEVREYIKDNASYNNFRNMCEGLLTYENCNELLEILDKENI